MDKEFSVGAPLVGALFGPKRSKTGPDEESAAGKPPLRRRNFGSGYARLGALPPAASPRNPGRKRGGVGAEAYNPRFRVGHEEGDRNVPSQGLITPIYARVGAN